MAPWHKEGPKHTYRISANLYQFEKKPLFSNIYEITENFVILHDTVQKYLTSFWERSG